MVAPTPRIVGTLVGDIVREPDARTKYGFFFEAVARRFPLVGVYDGGLRGLARLINALWVMHPNRRLWRERFHKNVAAFRIRSRRAAARLRMLHGQADVVLQVGVLFNACGDKSPLPNVIYTDYTARLSARKPSTGRSPFNKGQREQWIALERQTYERAAHICTRSKYVRDSILADYGISPERVSVIGGGANFAVLPEVVVRKNRNSPTALFIGKDLYRKGGDLLLRAFAKTRAKVPNARLLFLTGDPIPADLPMEGVEVIAPTWDRAAIDMLYRRADLFVLPSRLETWGDVLLEAMAHGLPCIGVAGEAMEEIIEEGKTGVIVPQDNVEALSEALTLLLKNTLLRERLGYAARQHLEAEYTWDHVVERLAPIIETAVLQFKR